MLNTKYCLFDLSLFSMDDPLLLEIIEYQYNTRFSGNTIFSPTMSSQPSFEYLALMSSSSSRSIQPEDFHSDKVGAHDCSTESSTYVRSSKFGGDNGNSRTRQRKLEVMEEITQRNHNIEYGTQMEKRTNNRKFQKKQYSVANRTFVQDRLISDPQELPCAYGRILDVFPWFISIIWIFSILLG